MTPVVAQENKIIDEKAGTIDCSVRPEDELSPGDGERLLPGTKGKRCRRDRGGRCSYRGDTVVPANRQSRPGAGTGSAGGCLFVCRGQGGELFAGPAARFRSARAFLDPARPLSKLVQSQVRSRSKQEACPVPPGLGSGPKVIALSTVHPLA